MIRKLQLRLTLLVLAFLLVILAGVVFAINYINWRDLTDQAEYSLEVMINNDGRRPGMMRPGEDGFPPPWAETESGGTNDVTWEDSAGPAGSATDADEAKTDDDGDEPDGGNDYEDFIDDFLDDRPFRPDLE